MATRKKTAKKAAPKQVAELKVEKPAEVPAKEAKKKEAPVVKQGQVNEIASTVRKIKNWLEVTMGADIDGDGKLGMTYLPVMVLALVAALIGGMAFADETIAVRYMASQGCDNIIELNADNADDTYDQLQFGINTDNDFTVTIGGVEVLNITKSGVATITTISADATNFTGGVSADTYIRLIDANGDATITSKAASGDFDGILILDADYGEDAADTWTIKSEATGNDLSILNSTDERFNLTSAGALSVDAGIAAGDAITLTDANGAAVISAIAASGAYDASIVLDANAGAANEDTWTITSQESGNDLSVINHTAEVLNLTSAGALQVDSTFTAAGAADVDNVTVNAGAGIDVQSAGALKVGVATATSVDIGVTAKATTIKGTLNVDEAVSFDSTLAVTGIATLTATPVLSAGLTVTTDATVGGTLAVTGVGTFIAESVHNAGIDADSITVDSDKGIDTKTEGALVVGAATADEVMIGASDIDTHILGGLDILGTTGDGLDTTGATALYIGQETATSVVIADTTILTDIAGTLSVDEAAVFDTTVGITGVLTLTAAPVVTAVTASGSAVPITTNAPACTEETPVWVTVTYDGSDYVMPIWLKD